MNERAELEPDLPFDRVMFMVGPQIWNSPPCDKRGHQKQEAYHIKRSLVWIDSMLVDMFCHESGVGPQCMRNRLGKKCRQIVRGSTNERPKRDPNEIRHIEQAHGL